jgi:hypothetical protein
LALFCAIAHDGGQWIECRRLNELQRVRVVMIERLVATFDQQLGFDVVRPASIVVEGYVAAVAGRAERFVQEFGRADSVADIAALCRDGNLLVIRFGEARCEQNLAAWKLSRSA